MSRSVPTVGVAPRGRVGTDELDTGHLEVPQLVEPEVGELDPLAPVVP